jgi:hypothetical protein
MICPTAKVEYFFEQDWTDKISLICLNKFRFPRESKAEHHNQPSSPRKRGPIRRGPAFATVANGF